MSERFGPRTLIEALRRSSDPRLEEVLGAATSYSNLLAPHPLKSHLTISELKAEAIDAGDQERANAVWCLETILRIQDHYLSSHSEMRAHRFYAAWQSLERAEVQIHFLRCHYDDLDGFCGVGFIRDMVAQIQSLFPYKHFISPAFLKLEQRCSVCNEIRRPRRSCGHKLGALYWGQDCGNVVTKIKPIEISIVTNPVQKYSVLFMPGARHNHAAAAYLMSVLNSPWHSWSVEIQTRRRIKPDYRNVQTDLPCPCMSGKPILACECDVTGFEIPHFQFDFTDIPDLDIANIAVNEFVPSIDDQVPHVPSGPDGPTDDSEGSQSNLLHPGVGAGHLEPRPRSAAAPSSASARGE